MSKKIRKLAAVCMMVLLVAQSNPVIYGQEEQVSKTSAICTIKEVDENGKSTISTHPQDEAINKVFTQAKETLKKKVTIKVEQVDKERLEKYIVPGPLVPYVRSAVLTSVDDKTIEAEINYTTWYQAIKAYREPNLYEKHISETSKKTLKRAKEIIKELKLDKETSAIVKEKAIHDYLISKGEYSEVIDGNMDAPMHGAEGLILNNDGLCRSYAEGMQLFMELLGVESKIIMGWSRNSYDKHVWNMVKLDDGNWYYVDLTWDEPNPVVSGEVNYDYFNIPFRILNVDHELEEWQVPEETFETAYSPYESVIAYCNDDVVDIIKKQLAAGERKGEVYIAFGSNVENTIPLVLRAMEATETCGKVKLDKKSPKIFAYEIFE